MEFVIVAGLVALSAVFSGLTIGMFSLDLITLENKIKLGDPRAIKVYSVRKKSSLLLVTLLLGNVAVNSTTALMLGTIAPGFLAGLLSTGLIVIFGEILPQAAFTRQALDLGAKTIWIVRFFIVLLYPIAAPLAWLLDRVLGEEMPKLWSKTEISEIIKRHEDEPDSNIDEDEERIVLGALSFSEKQAYDVMTPKTVVYSLNENTILNEKKILEIKNRGFSRIPVYQGNLDNIIGILYAKDLIGILYDTGLSAGTLCRKDKSASVDWSMNLDHLFNLMIKQRIHMAFVIDEFGVFNGIVTLEDIIEEILKIEIVDELDNVDDMQKLAKERMLRKRIK